jgi:hypothetical protein
MTNDDFNELQSKTAQIRDTALSIFDLETLYSRLKESQKKLELEISTAVVNEKDEAGKKKFSNAEQRQAEVEKLLVSNKIYQRDEMKLLDLYLKIGKGKIELQYLKDILENERLFFNSGDKNGN